MKFDKDLEKMLKKVGSKGESEISRDEIVQDVRDLMWLGGSREREMMAERNKEAERRKRIRIEERAWESQGRNDAKEKG